MKYAEIVNGKVRYIGGGPEYGALPKFDGIETVEIPEDADVKEGYLFENSAFRPSTTEEIFAEYRPAFDAERSRRFAETSWVRERHSDRLELGIDDSQNWRAWLDYWQALRDLPQQPDFDPRAANWPVKPE